MPRKNDDLIPGLKKALLLCDSIHPDGYYDDFPAGQRNMKDQIKRKIKSLINSVKKKH